jgi:hypothetical protein
MKVETDAVVDAEMLDGYDFSGGVRGKHAKRRIEGTRAVVLAPDVAELFPDAESVNMALRAVADAARRLVEPDTR